MALHDYSPGQALALLLGKIEERSPELASSLRTAIDAGKDVWESDDSVAYRKPREYRKSVRFSDEEALQVAVSALRAHFVERPLFTTSAVNEFACASLDVGFARHGELSADERPSPYEALNLIETRVEIELQTETRVSPSSEETVQLSSTEEEMIEDQKKNIERLFELTAFDSGEPWRR